MSEALAGYQDLNHRRERLIKLIEEIEQLSDNLADPPWRENARLLKTRIEETTYRVMVMGEFKRGKSTLINALLGRKVLPAMARPCTATIHQIKYAETPRALVYPRTPEGWPGEPQETSIEAVQGNGADGKQTALGVINKSNPNAPSPYYKIELFWPMKLLAQGVEIIDTPGLNEFEYRTDVTMNYLSKVDAVLFVLSCDQMGSTTEMHVIERVLIPSGYEDIFFACNRINLIPDDEKDELKEWVHEKLAHLVQPGSEERIFFLDCRGALESRTNGDEDGVAASGFLDFERALEKFLTKNKGRTKLKTAIKSAKDMVRQARRVLEEDESLARQNSDERAQNLRKIEIPFEALKKKRGHIQQKLVDIQSDLSESMKSESMSFWRTLTSELEGIALTIEPSIRIPIAQATKEKINRSIQTLKNKFYQLTEKDGGAGKIKEHNYPDIVEENVEKLTLHLKKRIQTEYTIWLSEELKRFLESKLDEIHIELLNELKEFNHAQDLLRMTMTGSDNHDAGIIDEFNEQMSEALKLVGKKVIQEAAGRIFIHFNPARLFLSVFKWDFTEMLSSPSDNINNSVRRELAAQFGQYLADSKYEMSEALAGIAAGNLETVNQEVSVLVDNELKIITNLVQKHYTTRQDDDPNLDDELAGFSALREKMDEIDQALDLELADLLS